MKKYLMLILGCMLVLPAVAALRQPNQVRQQGKEEGMSIQRDAEKQANARLSKVQSAEAKLKQREMQLNQQQGEVQRKRNELDNLKANVDLQSQVLDDRKKEVDRLEKTVRDTLEHVSGLSADEAKEKLIGAAHDGAIYLLHSVSETNAEVLGDVIDGIRGKGFEFN